MTELFEAAQGTIFKLQDVELDYVLEQADALLKGELFSSFGLCSTDPLPSPRALHLIGQLGGLSIPYEERITINTGDEAQTVLGFDIVKGKPEPHDGTTYERPVASDAKHNKRSELAGKMFAYVPLGEPIDISTIPECPQAVKPGYAFLSMQGEAHTVHIPADQVSLELVITENVDALQSEWGRYCDGQPNPNF